MMFGKGSFFGSKAKILKSVKGAGLVEYGMLAGLISIASIYGVSNTGEKTEEVFCLAAESIQDGFYQAGFGEPSDGNCTPLALTGNGADGEGFPILDPENQYEKSPDSADLDSRFDADDAIDDVDVIEESYVFEEGSVGWNYVLSAVSNFPEGSSEIHIHAPSVFGACIERKNSAIDCSLMKNHSRARIFSEPGDIQAGWVANLPLDPRVEWKRNFTFFYLDDARNIIQEVKIDTSRISQDYVFEPEFSFEDKTYAQGQSGLQEPVMAPLAGNVNGDMIWEARQKSFETKSCVKETIDSDIVCKEESVDVPQGSYAIGYQVFLKDDDLTRDISAEISGRLSNDGVQFYTDENGERVDLFRDETWRVGRIPVPFIFDPQMDFVDQEYTLGAAGIQKEVLVPLKGNFNDKLVFSLESEGDGGLNSVNLCRQATPSSPVNCSYSNTIPSFSAQDIYALGYRISLPKNEKDVVDTPIVLNLHIAGSEEESLSKKWLPNQYREAVPYIFAEDMDFSGTVSYDPASTGKQRAIMQVLKGEFNDDIGLNISWDKTTSKSVGGNAIEICLQKFKDGEIECEGDNRSDGEIFKLFSSADVYAVGYRANFSTSPSYVKDEISLPVDIRLSMPNTENEETWSAVQYRPAVPYIFKPDVTFPQMVSYEAPIGRNTPKHLVMVDLSGEFNDQVTYEFETVNFAGIKACIRQTPSSQIDCNGINSNYSHRQRFEGNNPPYQIGYELSPIYYRSFEDAEITFTMSMPRSDKANVVQKMYFTQPKGIY